MYGLCVDGDLHEIKPEFRETASENKHSFETFMFRDAIIKEVDITPKQFTILPPVACPVSPILPFENLSKPQRESWRRLKKKIPAAQTIKPFNGEFDSRSAIEFLYTFENHIDRRIETKTESKYCLYNLIKRVIPYASDMVVYLKYETLRGDLLTNYWSIEDQFKVYAEFLKTAHPMYQGQSVSEYVYHWVNRLRRNTIILKQDFVDKLMNRVPLRYGFHLVRHNRGAEWSEIYDTVVSCETDLDDLRTSKYRKRQQHRKTDTECENLIEF